MKIKVKRNNFKLRSPTFEEERPTTPSPTPSQTYFVNLLAVGTSQAKITRNITIK
jgi:hypothetical protein